MTATQTLLLILAAALGTLLLRASFLVLVPSSRLPGWARESLQFIPPAVLAALGITAFLPATTAEGAPTLARPAAALVALLVGLKFGRVFLTIAAGMVTLWLLSGVI